MTCDANDAKQFIPAGRLRWLLNSNVGRPESERMENKKMSFGEWLSDVLVGIILGAFWLLRTIPITTLSFFPTAVFSMLDDSKMDVSSNWLSWLAATMLIDGYFGHRETERKEQQVMQDFYRWHEEELKRVKRDKVEQ